jgi:hypothetical protein
LIDISAFAINKFGMQIFSATNSFSAGSQSLVGLLLLNGLLLGRLII